MAHSYVAKWLECFEGKGWMAHSYVAKCFRMFWSERLNGTLLCCQVFRMFWSERVNDNKSWNGGKELEWHANPLWLLYIFLFLGCWSRA
jgi:hypothetical protein